jgi:hypothetical protein
MLLYGVVTVLPWLCIGSNEAESKLLLLLRVCCAVWWHVIGCTTFVIMLPVVAPTHQTAEWVFTTFAPDQVFTGINSMPML